MDSFSEGDVANIVRRIESALYREDEENYDLVDLGGKVYVFPSVKNFYSYKYRYKFLV